MFFMISIIIKFLFLYSIVWCKEMIQYFDIYFNFNVQKFGFVFWKVYEYIWDEGYCYGKEVFEVLLEDVLKGLQVID